jgi:prophage regulatory protein
MNDQQTPIRLLRTAAVEKMTSLSRTEIYNRVKRGEFPKPIKLGRRSNAWPESAIEDWIKNLVKEASK